MTFLFTMEITRLKNILLVSQSLLKISINLQLTSCSWLSAEFPWVNKAFSAKWFKVIQNVSSSAVYQINIDWLELQINWLPCQTGTILKSSRSSTVPVQFRASSLSDILAYFRLLRLIIQVIYAFHGYFKIYTQIHCSKNNFNFPLTYWNFISLTNNFQMNIALSGRRNELFNIINTFLSFYCTSAVAN